MWTVVAYNSDGAVVALMATSSDEIALGWLDSLSEQPNVITVVGSYRPTVWAVKPPSWDEPSKVIVVEGKGLWRMEDRPSILRRQAD